MKIGFLVIRSSHLSMTVCEPACVPFHLSLGAPFSIQYIPVSLGANLRLQALVKRRPVLLFVHQCPIVGTFRSSTAETYVLCRTIRYCRNVLCRTIQYCRNVLCRTIQYCRNVLCRTMHATCAFEFRVRGAVSLKFRRTFFNTKRTSQFRSSLPPTAVVKRYPVLEPIYLLKVSVKR